MLEIKSLNINNSNFFTELNQLLAWDSSTDQQVRKTVRNILNDVKKTGDQALLDYTNRFDRLNAKDISELVLDKDRLRLAYENLPAEQKNALDISAQRVEQYHLKQKLESWSYTEDDGTLLGQKVTPLERVGLYVPGGQASYPSSVLMNAIPAKVAGVNELIMVVPTPDGNINELVLAAAYICDIDKVYAVGGAQAVAALAYGTQTIPQVDKIVGPGNIYVATAKSMVFGSVGIDMIAGPSEILVICDGKTNPDWIAMDLFSQAEHDEDAQSILVSQDSDFFGQVMQSINKLLPEMQRRDIIEKSLQQRAIFIQVNDLQQAADVCNHIAPEHLELSIDDPQVLLEQIKHAGAIFMGRYTAEALGDYCAGPNHVLPTSRTARFSSPLGVYDFQKRSSLIMCSADGASKLGKIASVMARGEGLTAHARSAEYRIK
ncbi:MAG: histidinol dehydrogenase [Pseudomonadota bacterium]